MYSLLYTILSLIEGIMGNLKAKLLITNTIHILRVEKKLTQQQLADEIGVTRLTVSSLEKGKYNPSLELALRISIFFEKSIHEVFIVGEENE